MPSLVSISFRPESLTPLADQGVFEAALRDMMERRTHFASEPLQRLSQAQCGTLGASEHLSIRGERVAPFIDTEGLSVRVPDRAEKRRQAADMLLARLKALEGVAYAAMPEQTLTWLLARIEELLDIDLAVAIAPGAQESLVLLPAGFRRRRRTKQPADYRRAKSLMLLVMGFTMGIAATMALRGPMVPVDTTVSSHVSPMPKVTSPH